MIRATKILVLLMLFYSNTKGQNNAGRWYQRASLPSHGYIGFNILGTIYMGGTSAFSKYNPNLNTYSPVSAPNVTQTYASFTIGGKGYILAEVASKTHIVEYNPDTNKWTVKQQFFGNAANDIGHFVLNNKFYIVSGSTNHFREIDGRQVWEYNPIADVFLRKNDLTFSWGKKWFNRAPIRGTTVGNYGYMMFDARTFYQYDSVTDNWYQKPATNEDYGNYTSNGGFINYHFNSFSFDGSIYYLVSESWPVNGAPAQKMFKYNPALENWILLGNKNELPGKVLTEKFIESPDYLYALTPGYQTTDNISWTPKDYLLYSKEIIPITSCLDSTNNFEFQLKFTAEGNFNTGNTFKLLLSNEKGEFTNPAIIDSISTGTSAIYVGTFTKSLSPAIWNPQKDYRLKVVASNPAVNDMFEIPIKSSVKYYPSVEITSSGSTSICQGSFVTLSVPNVVGQTYQWYNNGVSINGVTKNGFSISAAGNYSVKVTNSNGCTATSKVVKVTVNTLPVTPIITANGPLSFCQGNSVTLTSTAGNSYLWSNGDTTQSIIVNKGANYSVKVFNNNGCSTTSNVIVLKDLPLPSATIIANGPTTFCQGGTVSLIASNGKSYLWSNGAKTQEIIVGASGNYSVAVTNDNGCIATSAATAVTMNTVTEKATITANGPTTFCPDGSVTLTASVGNSYLWSNGEKTQSITVNKAGNYNVKVTNSSTCTLTSETITISITPLPTVRISPLGPTTFCQGESVTLISSTGKSYLWSTGETTQSIKVNSSGNFSVKMTNENGCSNTSEPISVTVTALPTVTITASGPTSFCQGGFVTLTSNSGSSYLWSTGETTQSIKVSSSGNYSLKMTNNNGCSNTSAPLAVTVSPTSTATITANGPTSFCQGESVTLTSNSGSSYLWSNGATTQSINVSSSGNYSVTVKNVNGCTPTSSPTSVIVNALPKAEITASGPKIFCLGESVTLTASIGTSYLWSTGATSQSIVVDKAGNYSVKVTNANGCSTTSSPTVITVSTFPNVAITTSGPTTITQNGNVILGVNNVAGQVYQWFKNTVSIGSATSSVYKATSGGIYTVKVTNSAGCASISSPVMVKSILVLPANNFQISIIPESCRTSDNGKIIIKAAENLNYSASLTKSGQALKTVSFNTNTEISDLSAGKYTVCITVAGQSDYRQCFDVVVTEPQDLAVYSYVERSNNSLILNMSGGDTYYVTLNDSELINRSSKMSLNLKRGWNKIKIKADKECQGVFTEEIYIDEQISAFPNPFTSILNIKIDQKENKLMLVKVLDQSGLAIYQENFNVNNNLISIDLSKLKNGYYFVVVGSNTYKVIKK